MLAWCGINTHSRSINLKMDPRFKVIPSLQKFSIKVNTTSPLQESIRCSSHCAREILNKPHQKPSFPLYLASLSTATTIQRLWNDCNLLREDGFRYGDYVEQLTHLLFLKMAHEQTQPPSQAWNCIQHPVTNAPSASSGSKTVPWKTPRTRPTSTSWPRRSSRTWNPRSCSSRPSWRPLESAIRVFSKTNQVGYNRCKLRLVSSRIEGNIWRHRLCGCIPQFFSCSSSCSCPCPPVARQIRPRPRLRRVKKGNSAQSLVGLTTRPPLMPLLAGLGMCTTTGSFSVRF